MLSSVWERASAQSCRFTILDSPMLGVPVKFFEGEDGRPWKQSVKELNGIRTFFCLPASPPTHSSLLSTALVPPPNERTRKLGNPAQSRVRLLQITLT
jgi:hypothetical protein